MCQHTSQYFVGHKALLLCRLGLFSAAYEYTFDVLAGIFSVAGPWL